MALIDWCSDAATKRPKRIDAPPAKAGPHVLPAFDAGTLVLQRGKKAFTLAWDARDKDKRRALPPGEYKLRQTHLVRHADDSWWFLSQGGPPAKTIRVAATGATKVSIPDTIKFAVTTRREDGVLHIGFTMRCDKRNVTVYKDGRRVPVTYVVFDGAGKPIATGKMTYG